MRNMMTLTAVASVLAIGVATTYAAPLFPGEGVGNPEGALHKIQRGGEGPGTSSPGARGGDGGAGARGGDGGGRGGGQGATRGATKGGDGGAGLRSGERGTRGDGAGPQTRGRVDIDGARRGDRAERRSRVDVEGDRGRGRDRVERRSRGDIDVDRRDRRRRAGRRGVDVYVERGYGYGPSCAWLRRRALDTGSRYWWRRYRACIGD